MPTVITETENLGARNSTELLAIGKAVPSTMLTSSGIAGVLTAFSESADRTLTEAAPPPPPSLVHLQYLTKANGK